MQMRDTENALRALDQAISINPDDDVLYHMKGMALRNQLYEAMSSGEASKQALDSALDLAHKAAEQFAIARTKEPDDEHGYISHIQMLLKLIEFAKRATGTESAQQIFISPTINASLRESLDLAEDLLEQARRLREGDRPSFHVERCRVQMDALYGKFDVVLSGWNNLLTRPDVYRPPIRRQLVQAYLVRKSRRWDNLDAREISRIVELLEQNILEEPNDRKNLRLWMQAVRRAQPPMALDHVIERVSYWRANSFEIDPVYYLYILYTLKAMDGYVLALDPLKENLDECRRRARLRPNRTGSFEWIGPGQGLRQLVHYTELGDWSDEQDFWEGSARLCRIKGTIISISGPEAGLIEVRGGVRAFFVPGKSGHSRGRDENRAVDCFLGFSYDGPRAWEVRNA
jgi:tetratricopeptide (TPR) repeat protein